MKGRTKVLFLLCILLGSLLCLPAAAEESVTEQVEQVSGVEGLWTSLPEEVTDLLEKAGIFGVTYGTVRETDVASLVGVLLPSIGKRLKEPLKAGGQVLLTLLLCALVGNLCGQVRTVERVSVAVCALTFLPALLRLFLRIQSLCTLSATFLQAYVPVLAGLTVASGQGGRAATGSAFLLGVSALLQTAAEQWILPLGGMLMALAAMTAGDTSPASAFADLLFRLLKWGLTLLAVVAGGMFALQTGLSSVADSLSLRGAKFAVSGMVPLVGGTLSDALGTVLAAAGTVRASAGAVALIAMALLFLPSIAELLLWTGLCRFALFFADGCSSPLTANLFDSLKKLTDVLLAATALTAAVSVFATAVLTKAGSGL